MTVDMFFTVRFVRYWDGQSALRATSELNGWKLKGQTILVDISKQTSTKMQKGIIHYHNLYQPWAILHFNFNEEIN